VNLYRHVSWLAVVLHALLAGLTGAQSLSPAWVEGLWAGEGASELLAGEVLSSPVPGDGRAVQFIEGYTGLHSYEPGDRIEFHVSTNSPTYGIEMSRVEMPWWVFEPVVETVEGLPGSRHDMPPDGWLGARWPVSYEMTVGESWRSGCYVARFITEDGSEARHLFYVRPGVLGSVSRIAFIANFSTLAAYNDWGGRSFYTMPRAFESSLLRPFKSAWGLGRSQWNLRLMCHLEELGFDLEYITEQDVEEDPEVLHNYDVVVLAGHHEYVSTRFYDALQDHHDRGGHLAMFDADGLYWQVRIEQNGDVVVGYKERAEQYDPMYGRIDCLVTTSYNSELLGRPAAALRGVQRNDLYQYFLTGDYTMVAEDHWIFAGTGIQNGEVFGTRMAASEQDTLQPESPIVDILLHGRRDQIDPDAPPPPVGEAHMYAVFYADTERYGFPEGNGGMVFTAGSITGWIRSMYDAETGWMVKMATSNILDGMLGSPPPPFGGGDVAEFCNPCRGDFNGDARVDTVDFIAYLAAWVNRFASADWDHDGDVDTKDFVAFLSDWAEGCE
jgi:hypothetical protein